MSKRKKVDKRGFWTLDSETDPFLHGRIPEPFIWGIYDGVFFETFSDTEKMVARIKEYDGIVYAHSGGRFDFHFILKHLNPGEELKVINGSLVSGHIGKCEIRDSWNILPAPQAQFANKYEIVDFSIFEKNKRNKPKNRDEIIKRLKSDVEDLYYVIKKSEEQFGRHLTRAGASMARWEAISGIKAPVTNRGFFDEFSKFYYGGRVQKFITGHIEGPIEVVDIHSAYPWAMLSPHPYDPVYHKVDYPTDILPTSMVTLTAVSRGALPWRNDKGSIVFPDDDEKRTYYVPGHEVLAAIATNSISDVSIIEAINFVGLVSFAPYIHEHYDLRLVAKEIGDKAGDTLNKMSMNGLSGKFGANPDNYGNFAVVDFDEISNYRQRYIREHKVDVFDPASVKYIPIADGMVGNKVLMKAPLMPEQEHFINVATIASITSQARSKLWRAIHASEGVVYCDTDSIFARKACVEIGSALGQWEREGIASDAWIAGKKMYYLEGDFGFDKKANKPKTEKKASKGVNLNASQLKHIAMGGEAVYKADPPTFRLGADTIFQERRVRATS